ncbi:hypothetical protein PTSG_01439 [Salpingoeca rosetta]|uniref:Uncharacterized protein n=1 Tax=Salpingoeca rosetta (strain ATCC 50818 / BSB-021) TaxID=946362 RepID=F2U0C5_SALR5|nr:uncharacterized protein PTSG_01439 [Salpingoeca rosetta]EGD80853.1 hypothetical protein PTSG_01439 [Salpingoeca rosetta]|eukprot:XP_004997414.1 hypothetical protein PTSG_01439 [Salpingoeca rosetta]
MDDSDEFVDALSDPPRPARAFGSVELEEVGETDVDQLPEVNGNHASSGMTEDTNQGQPSQPRAPRSSQQHAWEGEQQRTPSTSPAKAASPASPGAAALSSQSIQDARRSPRPGAHSPRKLPQAPQGQSPPPKSPSSPRRRQPASPTASVTKRAAALRMEDDVRPSAHVHNHLNLRNEQALSSSPDTNGSVFTFDEHAITRNSTMPSASSDIVISGRLGHASCINGEYVKLDGAMHDGKEVFRHREPIPPGFSENSGRFLHLAFYESNDAWAISTQLGSLDVVAYTLGDVLNPTHVAMMGPPLWYISSGEGQYEPDERVQMWGRRVPEPRMDLYKEALSLPHHDNSFEEDMMEDLPEEPENEEEEAEEEERAEGASPAPLRLPHHHHHPQQHEREHHQHLDEDDAARSAFSPRRRHSPLVPHDQQHDLDHRHCHDTRHHPHQRHDRDIHHNDDDDDDDGGGSGNGGGGGRQRSSAASPRQYSGPRSDDETWGEPRAATTHLPPPTHEHVHTLQQQQQQKQERAGKGGVGERVGTRENGVDERTGGGGLPTRQQKQHRRQKTPKGESGQGVRLAKEDQTRAKSEEAEERGQAPEPKATAATAAAAAVHHAAALENGVGRAGATTKPQPGQQQQQQQEVAGSDAADDRLPAVGEQERKQAAARAELSSALAARRAKKRKEEERLHVRGFERSASLGSRAAMRVRERTCQRRANSMSEGTRRGKRSSSDSSTGSGAHRERSGSLRRFGSRLSRSIRRFPGSRRMRQTLSDTKLRLQRLSRKETPAEALGRHVKRFRAAQGERDKMTAVDDFRKPYFEVLLNVMTRDEVQIFYATQDDIEGEGRAWIKAACQLIWQTHSFVVDKLSAVVSQESLLLFCAKALAVNYFLVPDLAQVIVTAVSRATPISSRRSRKIGSLLYSSGLEWMAALEKFIPLNSKNAFYNIYQLCGVDVTATSDQHPATCPRVPYYHEHAILTTHPTYHTIMQRLQLDNTPDLLDDALWLGNRAAPASWTSRFVTDTEAGFGFLAVFLEVLVRRAKSLYRIDYFDSKADQQLGINRKSSLAIVFCPGFLELSACYLRLALTTRHAVKWATPAVITPTNLICNWSDRTAACALAMSVSGVFFSTLFHDLMLQTSVTHVADVISLLSSFQAFLKCYHHMHGAPLPSDVNLDLFLKFLQRLTSCHHYVVTMFALRWTYDCLDYFHEEQRARITHFLTQRTVLEPLLCHWESNVRHLMHTLVLFRLFPPAQSDLQLGFVQAIRAQVEHPQLHPDSYQPLSPALIAHANLSPAVAALYQQQVRNVQDVVQQIIELHKCSGGPPYSCLSRRPLAPPSTSSAALQSIYAVETLNQLAASAVEAGKWFKDARHRPSSERPVPAITMAMPPLQNMTSMYTRAKPSRY